MIFKYLTTSFVYSSISILLQARKGKHSSKSNDATVDTESGGGDVNNNSSPVENFGPGDNNNGGPTPIIGGRPLGPNERPYLASLGFVIDEDTGEYFSYCGSTLVAPRIVLSAAREFF